VKTTNGDENIGLATKSGVSDILQKKTANKAIGLATKSGVSDKRIEKATKYINKRQNQPKNGKERQND